MPALDKRRVRNLVTQSKSASRCIDDWKLMHAEKEYFVSTLVMVGYPSIGVSNNVLEVPATQSQRSQRSACTTAYQAIARSILFPKTCFQYENERKDGGT